MNGKLLTYFEKAAISNKISHAFLVCNTSFDKIKLDLENVLNNYFFNENIDLTNSLDVLIVNPQKDKITKEQIIDIQMELANKSQINDNRVYIITEANKMNDYAANSLLKFLEEPQENVYAFLITNNIDNVLPTIKSRCQIIYVDNVEENCLDLYSTDDVMCTLNLIDLIEKKKYFCFPYIYDIISKAYHMKYFSGNICHAYRILLRKRRLPSGKLENSCRICHFLPKKRTFGRI